MSILHLGIAPIVILVTGSREFDDYVLMYDTLDMLAQGHHEVTIWHGKCNPFLAGKFVEWDWALKHPNLPYVGADWMADGIAREEGWEVKHFPANWSHGRGAGPQRNAKMIAAKPDVVAGFRKGVCNGTIGCLEMALRAGIPIVAP